MRTRSFLPGAAAVLALALLVAAWPPPASGDGGGDGSSHLTGDELQKLVAPVALYPDQLLSTVLRAATVPLQIVEAQRYLDQHASGGSGDSSQCRGAMPSSLGKARSHFPWPMVSIGPAVITLRSANTAMRSPIVIAST